MKSKRDAGLDILKAVSITFVLLWHLQPFKFKTETENILTNIPNFIIDKIVNFQILLTAVPVFFWFLCICFLETLRGKMMLI